MILRIFPFPLIPDDREQISNLSETLPEPRRHCVGSLF